MPEINTPADLEPTPGVDTTTEGLAKKYGQEVPKDVKKQVLNPQGTAPAKGKSSAADLKAKGALEPPADPDSVETVTAPADTATTSTPAKATRTSAKAPAAPKKAANKNK